MNYPEELRERYNEVMFDERDIIEKFLKDQYDIRYGRQRDTWHFEPAVKMMNIYGNEIHITDVMLDKDVFVKFIGTFCNEHDEYECFHFAYGELSKVIEALPNAEDIVWDNAVNDLKVEVKWKGYTIVRWLAVIDMNNGEIIDEVDSVAEYRRAYRKSNTSFVYAAAEIINKDGDCNPAVYGATLKEAMDKIKKVL